MRQRPCEQPGRAQPGAPRRVPTAARTPLAGPVLSPAAVEGLPEDCSTDSSAIEAIYFEFSDDSELAESCRRC